MSDVPEEVLREMLSRVAVEPLLRSRSVNKEWRGIIDNPSFSQHHSDQKMGGNSILIRTGTGKLYYFPLDTLNLSKSCTRYIYATSINNNVVVEGDVLPRISTTLPLPCCNDLVLISDSVGKDVWSLWNPFTGKSIELPPCQDFEEDVKVKIVCCGLAHDVATNDDKVVRVATIDDRHLNPRPAYRTSIYSTELGIWRRVEDFPSRGGRRIVTSSRDAGVFLNNGLHWIASVMVPGNFDMECIVVLDLLTETYREIELPPDSLEGWRHTYGRTRHLDAVGGNLFLSCRSWGTIGSPVGPFLDFFDLWVWEECEQENKWTELVSMQRNFNMLPMCDLRPIAYMKHKHQVLLQYNDNKFMWFDVEKNTCTSKVSLKGIDGVFSSQVLPTSLFWLNGSSDADKRIASNGSLFSLNGSSDADQSSASNGRPKRMKRVRTNDRLQLKLRSWRDPLQHWF